MSFVSASSQIQALVFPKEEMAQRLGRRSTHCPPRAVEYILQALQRSEFRTLIAGPCP